MTMKNSREILKTARELCALGLAGHDTEYHRIMLQGMRTVCTLQGAEIEAGIITAMICKLKGREITE